MDLNRSVSPSQLPSTTAAGPAGHQQATWPGGQADVHSSALASPSGFELTKPDQLDQACAKRHGFDRSAASRCRKALGDTPTVRLNTLEKLKASW